MNEGLLFTGGRRPRGPIRAMARTTPSSFWSSDAASSFASVDVESSCGSCKRPAGRASSPFIVDLSSAGPGAGASAGGLCSSLELYIYLWTKLWSRVQTPELSVFVLNTPGFRVNYSLPRQKLTFHATEIARPGLASILQAASCASPGLRALEAAPRVRYLLGSAAHAPTVCKPVDPSKGF